MCAEFALSPTEKEETIKNLIVPAMIITFAALNQKSDELEQHLGHGEGMTPVAETVPGGW